MDIVLNGGRIMCDTKNKVIKKRVEKCPECGRYMDEYCEESSNGGLMFFFGCKHCNYAEL
jgi:hypothetical protein